MKRKHCVWIALCLPVFLALMVPLCAVAQAGGGFSETFDDATLPGWEHSQDVTVVDGLLRIYPENLAFRIGAWAYPDLTVRLRLSSPGGVVLHYHATERGVYRLHLTADGTHAELMLQKESAGIISELGKHTLQEFKSGDWNTIRIVFRSGQHQVSFNDTVLITAEDAEPLIPGSIGFFVFGENPVEIDDLTVTPGEGIPGAVQGETEMSGGVITSPEEPLPPAPAPTTSQAASQAGSGELSLLDELFVSGVNLPDMTTFLVNLGLAALLSFILSQVYVHWGASLSNRRKFASNFLLISLTTTFIILVVRSSVALSLGLVGALSIVRFRAAIKEPEELAYLFMAVGLGIGLGDNQRLITILAFAVAIIVLGLMKVFRHSQADVNMHLNIVSQSPAKPDMGQVMAALAPHCSKLRLLRFDENEHLLEMSFLVELRHVTDLSAARDALQQLAPQVDITFLDNKGIW